MRRGFTVIEVMLALMLSALVISSAVAMYQFLLVATRDAGERFNHAIDETLAHDVLTQTFQNLVAAEPLTPEEAGVLEGEPAGEEEFGDEALNDRARAATPFGAGSFEGEDERIRARAAAGTPVMFELLWEEFEDGVTAPALEIVALEAPFPMEVLTAEQLGRPVSEDQIERWSRPDYVRGRLEVAEDVDGSWVLHWRPTDPPAAPMVLFRDIAWVEWSVLMPSRESARVARRDEGWVDVHSAFLLEDFPIAVRLVLETEDGRDFDWLFEVDGVVRKY